MRNFKILLIQEFRQQVKSFKFLLMLALILIVTISTAYVQIVDLKERYQNYQIEALKAKEEASKACTFAQLHVSVIIPPNPLSIFSKGFDEKQGIKLPFQLRTFLNLKQFLRRKTHLWPYL